MNLELSRYTVAIDISPQGPRYLLGLGKLDVDRDVVVVSINERSAGAIEATADPVNNRAVILMTDLPFRQLPNALCGLIDGLDGQQHQVHRDSKVEGPELTGGVFMWARTPHEYVVAVGDGIDAGELADDLSLRLGVETNSPNGSLLVITSQGWRIEAVALVVKERVEALLAR